MVREFKLLNEKGQSFSLMDIYNYCLLTEITGLGIEYTNEYEQLNNTFIINKRKFKQSHPGGIANFINYDNYKKFVDFIEQSEQLRLAYKIPFQNTQKEYLKDVNIQALTKSEIQENGVISEQIKIDSLTLWYEENTTIYTIEPQTNEIRWDFSWDSRFADYDSRSLPYINKGHVEAPVEISIDGHIINPVIELYVEGQLYQRVGFNVEIREYEKLLYGTKENDFYIMKQNSDGTLESLFSLDVIDFDNDNVIRIPKNKSCELRLTADNEILKAEVTILPQYKAV